MIAIIRINAYIVGGYWAVACKNSTRGPVRIFSASSLASTKKQARLHGFGTRQAQKIAEETGGYATFSQEGYEFTALAMILLAPAGTGCEAHCA